MNKNEAKSLIDQSSSNKLELQLNKPALSKPGTLLFQLSEVDEGCACSMLTDNADWNAPTWEFQPTLIDDLASSIRLICKQAANGFVFQALWAGDKPKKVVKLSCHELLDIVRSNRVATVAQYVVTAAEQAHGADSPVSSF